MKVTDIAKVVHEANKAYCECIGDNTQKSWENCEDWQRLSAIDGVKGRIKNPNTKPHEQHQKWVDFKTKNGWVYGKVKDASKKTHPCLVDYDDLPNEEKLKDTLFCNVVDSLT